MRKHYAWKHSVSLNQGFSYIHSAHIPFAPALAPLHKSEARINDKYTHQALKSPM